MSQTQSAERPSGKNASYENFPVGSWLLPARLRPHIAVFYAFARAIDDIADDPDLAAEDKISRLSGFDDTLTGKLDDPAFASGLAMAESLARTGVSNRHCRDLIKAFKQDAVKGRYDGWRDLMDYCFLSAAPVGRYLLDLHGGSNEGYGPSDALCLALQVINHLQDCRDDYVRLDRVYLPRDWMKAAGSAAADLDRDRCSPELRRVIDRALAGVRGLMAEAERLPGALHSKRLAMESAAIIEIAHRLAARLSAGDPLPRRIELSKPDFIRCCLRGVSRVLL
jgi:squalene synthase HpnC